MLPETQQLLKRGACIVLVGISTMVLWNFLFSEYFDNIPSTKLSVVAGVYFFVWSAASVFVFKDLLCDVMTADFRSFLLLAIFLLAVVIFYSTLSSDTLRSLWQFQHGYDTTPPADLFGGQYVFAKTAEIAFQQILIAAGVIVANRFLASTVKVSLLFMVIFSISHVSQLVGHTASWVTVSVSVGSLTGLVFPYLILRIQNGIIFSFMLHWSFYVGLTLWFMT